MPGRQEGLKMDMNHQAACGLTQDDVLRIGQRAEAAAAKMLRDSVVPFWKMSEDEKRAYDDLAQLGRYAESVAKMLPDA
jgi:hypothetical protein